MLWDGEEKTVKRFKLKVGKEDKSLNIDFEEYKQKYPEIKSWQDRDLAELPTCKHDDFDFEG